MKSSKTFDYVSSLIDVMGNPYASRASDGLVGSVTNYIDTGSYVINALLSGSIFNGLPGNKITALAGEEATGKTYFLLGLFKNFLELNKNNIGMLFETEGALTDEILLSRGIDPDRLVVIPVTTIEEFRHQLISVLDKHEETDEANRPGLLVALDSLGNISTSKEIEDMTSGSEKRDMTRAQLIKGTFRVLSLKLSKLNVPMVITNHIYAKIGSMYPDSEMSGGGGLKYAASTILFLSKRKEKDGKEVIGNIIHCKTKKSRLTKENKMVDTLLTYDGGLHRYYGLSDLAVKYDIFKKVSTRLELPDGTKVFEKSINSDPEKYFTKEILEQIDECAKTEFLYGSFINNEEFGEDQDGKEEKGNFTGGWDDQGETKKKVKKNKK
jgi:RecA/RadA recombinase